MSATLLISVIDDDGWAREAITGLVRSLGFSTAGFESAALFLRSEELQRTACMIADVRMVGMSGPELHRALVAAGTPIPTILITAYPDETVRRRAMEAGVSAYLAKPVKADELLLSITNALATRPGQGPDHNQMRPE